MILSRWKQRVQQMLAGPSASSRPRRCRLTVEALEQRALLSGGADDAVIPPPDSATEAPTTTTVDDNPTGAEDPSGGGHGFSSGPGYPLPPGKGVILTGTLGVDPTPVPALPPLTSPTGTTGSTTTTTTTPTTPPAGPVVSSLPVLGNPVVSPAAAGTGASSITALSSPTLVALGSPPRRHPRSKVVVHHRVVKPRHVVHHAVHHGSPLHKVT